MAEEQDARHHHDGGAQAQLQQLPHTLVEPVGLAGADVLPGVGGGRHAEGEVGHHGEAVHAHDGGGGGHDRLAHGVGQALHHDGGHGENRLSDARGQAQQAQLFGQVAVGHQGAQVHVHHIPHGTQADQAQQAGDRLGNDGGPGHARHTHAEVRHEGDVQHDVQQAGDNQEKQRENAVTQAAQDAGEDVVQRAAQDAQEDDLQVGDSAGGNGFRGLDHGDERGGGQVAHHGHQQARGQGQGDGAAHHLVQGGAILRAEVLGGQDARAGGDAHEQHQQQVKDGACGTHGGQGGIADIPAHDNGVHRVVQLLGQVADKQRHGELDQPAHGAALGHVLYAEEGFDTGCHGHMHCPHLC